MNSRHLYCRSALTPEGWLSNARVSIDASGIITEVAEAEPGQTSGQNEGHLLPGMPNLHSHAFQRQMAGLAETSGGKTDNFWAWREAMYRLANRINPRQLQAIAAWLQAEMLEAGYTSCAEFHYVHHQPGGQAYDDSSEMSKALLEAADASGISLTLLPVLYCRSGFAAQTVTDRQQRFFHHPEDFLRLLGALRARISEVSRHRLGWAPHSLRAVSRQQLDIVLNSSEAADLPVHIHVAEQPAEVTDCLEQLGARPVEYLLDQFPVGADWCLVHATHLSDSELQRAAASGATAGLCPSTEADLGDGFFPAEAWIGAEGKLGIGSDSNLRICVSEELRLLEFGCRLRTLGRNVISDEGRSCGRSLFQRAVHGGASAMAQKVGKIAPGYRADMVALNDAHPLLDGRKNDAILDSWIFAGGRGMIRSVWVAGERCVDNGRHVRKDALEVSFAQAAKELL